MQRFSACCTHMVDGNINEDVIATQFARRVHAHTNALTIFHATRNLARWVPITRAWATIFTVFTRFLMPADKEHRAAAIAMAEGKKVVSGRCRRNPSPAPTSSDLPSRPSMPQMDAMKRLSLLVAAIACLPSCAQQVQGAAPPEVQADAKPMRFECRPLTAATSTCTFLEEGKAEGLGFDVMMINDAGSFVGAVSGRCKSLETVATLRQVAGHWYYTQTRYLAANYETDPTCASPRSTWTTTPVTWKAEPK